MGINHVTFLLWRPSLGPWRHQAIPGEMALATVNQMISHLSDEEKQRYSQKIDILGFDPYLLPNQLLTPLKSVVILPNMSFGDIYIYLVHNPQTIHR